MPRKKRKKTGKKSKFKWNDFFENSVQFILKVIPVFLIVFLSSAVYVGVREALYADPNLSIQEITIAPADTLTTSQKGKLETLLMGKNILEINIFDISRDLERDPWIENAKVIKKFPTSVSVEIVRRLPFAYIRFSKKGSYSLISEDGVILETVKDHNVVGLKIDALSLGGKRPAVGRKMEIKGFYEAVQFIAAFQNHSFSKVETISKIELDHLGNVTIRLGAGPDVRLGKRPIQSLESFDKLLPLLENSRRKKIDYVDLQFDNVIVKQKR